MEQNNDINITSADSLTESTNLKRKQDTEEDRAVDGVIVADDEDGSSKDKVDIQREKLSQLKKARVATTDKQEQTDKKYLYTEGQKKHYIRSNQWPARMKDTSLQKLILTEVAQHVPISWQPKYMNDTTRAQQQEQRGADFTQEETSSRNVDETAQLQE